MARKRIKKHKESKKSKIKKKSKSVAIKKEIVKDNKKEMDLDDEYVSQLFSEIKEEMFEEFTILDKHDESETRNEEDLIDDRFMTMKVVDISFPSDILSKYFEQIRQQGEYHIDNFYDLVIEYIYANEEEYVSAIKEKFFIAPNNIESIDCYADDCNNIIMSISYLSLSDE